MLALNSSILVAAPRWRRLLCLLSHLAPAHRQDVQLSGATPSSAIRVLAIRSGAKWWQQKSPQGPCRRRRARESVQEMLRKRILTRGRRAAGFESVHRTVDGASAVTK